MPPKKGNAPATPYTRPGTRNRPDVSVTVNVTDDPETILRTGPRAPTTTTTVAGPPIPPPTFQPAPNPSTLGQNPHIQQPPTQQSQIPLTTQSGQATQAPAPTFQNPPTFQPPQIGQPDPATNIMIDLPAVSGALHILVNQSTGPRTDPNVPIPSVEPADPNPAPSGHESQTGTAEVESGDDEHGASPHPVRTIANPGPRVLVSTYSFGPDHIDQTPPDGNGGDVREPASPPFQRGSNSGSHHSHPSQEGTSPEPPTGDPNRTSSSSSGSSSSHSSRGSGDGSQGRRRWFTPAPGGSPAPDPGAEVAGPLQPRPVRSFWEILWEQIYAGLMHLISPQAQFSTVAGFTLLIFQLCSAGRLCYKRDGQCIWDHLLAVTPFIGKHFISWFCLLGANTLAVLGLCDTAIGQFGQLEPILMLLTTFGLKKLPIFLRSGDVSVPIRFIWISGGIHLVKWFLQAIEIHFGRVRQHSLQLRRPFVLVFLCALVALAIWLNLLVWYRDKRVAGGWWYQNGSERGFIDQGGDQGIEGVNMIKVTHKVVTKWVDPTDIAYGPT